MTYFCFVESSLEGVQHMEPLDADCVDDARRMARRMLLEHTDAYAAHIFSEDQHVATIRGRDIAAS